MITMIKNLLFGNDEEQAGFYKEITDLRDSEFKTKFPKGRITGGGTGNGIYIKGSVDIDGIYSKGLVK